MGVSYSGGIAVKGGGLKTGLKPAGPAPAPTVSAVHFDGTNDLVIHTGGLDVEDGKEGLISFWTKMTAGDASNHRFYILDNGTSFTCIRATSNKIQLIGRNAAFATRISMVTTDTLTTEDDWVHVLASWNLAAGESQFAKMYFNNVDVTAASPTIVDGTILYSADVDHSVGSLTGPSTSQGVEHDLAEFYMNFSESLDISDPDERAKFIDQSTLKPVDLGANGETPTTNSPEVYLTGDYTTWNAGNANVGTGGTYAVVGALSDPGTSPSDN